MDFISRWLRFALCLLIVGCLAGCSGNDDSSEQAVDRASKQVETIYKQTCITCHGADLEGKVGPSLQTIGATMTKEQIADIISNGKGIMPPLGKQLDADQIETLAVWLAAKK